MKMGGSVIFVYDEKESEVSCQLVFQAVVVPVIFCCYEQLNVSFSIP
jgi:hypothetical protein